MSEVKRPKRGPYPSGVINGPEPTTKRGERRRARKNEAAVVQKTYTPPA